MRRFVELAVSVTVLAGLSALQLGAVEWDPIDPATLAVTAPRIDPSADSEAIFRQVWIDDRVLGGEQPQTVETNYLRVKIFTERGVEEQSTIDLASATSANIRISDIQGRTIKPDGRIVELEGAAVFERSVVRASGVNVRMRSFSMPNVEVGDIVEYQWVEYRDNVLANYLRLDCQMEMPAWNIIFRVRPLERLMNFGYRMRIQTFGCDYGPLAPEGFGYYRLDVKDAHAYKEEASMPPELQARTWALLFYARDKDTDPERFWREYAKELFDAFKQESRADGTIKQAAEEITAGAAGPDEKIQRIREYCLREVRLLRSNNPRVSAEERANAKENKKPSDTLRNGLGTGRDINMLFLALANAAGVEARVAATPRRNERFFDPNFLNPYFLDAYVIAVPNDGGWAFYDFTQPYLEDGMLHWSREGVLALIADPKNSEWVQTPMSLADRTTAKREGEFQLLADGTLTGRVEQSYSGHLGLERKNVYAGLSEDERIERIENLVTRRLPGAEVSDISVMHAADQGGPFLYSYTVNIPGYAAATGQRLFLQPNYFQKNASPRFQVNERQHDVYFEYPWSEVDNYTIDLPEGFTLESPEKPQGIKIGDVGVYRVEIMKQGDQRVIYQRQFDWGLSGVVLFPKEAYPQLKGAFDSKHQQDQQVLTVRRAAVGQ